MFKTNYQNIEYCFYDDYMTVAGAPIRYSEMVDITHKGGEVPSFAFTYGDRRFTIPYEPADRNMIAPYFVKANKTPSELNKSEELPAGEPEYTEPAENEVPVEPAENAEQPEYTEPAESEVPLEPTENAEQPEYTEPAESEAAAEAPTEEFEPLGEENSKAASGGLGSKIKSSSAGLGAVSKKTKLIIGIIAAAVILGIILFVALGGMGQSIEGMDGRVRSHDIEAKNGQVQTVAEIDTDADVEDYAADFAKKCMDGKSNAYWLFNEKKKETVMFSNQDGVILICSFDMVDGEKDDPDIYGTGAIRSTWIYYMDSGELVKI